jgi:hypothetical protein
MPMSTNHSQPSFTDNLIAMREHYQSLLVNYEAQTTHARDQLAHINALLVEQFVPAPEHASVPYHAELHASELPRALTGALDSIFASAPTEPEPVSVPSDTISSKPSSEKISDNGTAESLKTKPKSARSFVTRKGTKPESKLPILAPYTGMSKVEAAAKIMQEQSGKVVHLDQIIHALHGELSETDLKVERDRMRNTLNRAIHQGLLAKVKNQEMSYTLDLKLLNSSGAGKTAAKSRGKAKGNARTQSTNTAPQPSNVNESEQPGYQPQYQGNTLTESVENVMQAYPGKVMTTESVAKVLYGDIDSNTLIKVRKKLNGVFSRGISQQRWQRVRGQKGAYILK